MSDYKLGEVETRFAELIWENEPLGSGELVKICAEKLGWKKSTTYTVLRKLCEKGYFRNENAAEDFRGQRRSGSCRRLGRGYRHHALIHARELPAPAWTSAYGGDPREGRLGERSDQLAVHPGDHPAAYLPAHVAQ